MNADRDAEGANEWPLRPDWEWEFGGDERYEECFDTEIGRLLKRAWSGKFDRKDEDDDDASWAPGEEDEITWESYWQDRIVSARNGDSYAGDELLLAIGAALKDHGDFDDLLDPLSAYAIEFMIAASEDPEKAARTLHGYSRCRSPRKKGRPVQYDSELCEWYLEIKRLRRKRVESRGDPDIRFSADDVDQLKHLIRNGPDANPITGEIPDTRTVERFLHKPWRIALDVFDPAETDTDI